MAMADMTTPTQPGPFLYFDAIGGEPVPVELRETGDGLGVFFEGRDDYDLLADVSGRFEPDVSRALEYEQQQSGLTREEIDLYAAIYRHDGFTTAGAHAAFAHLSRDKKR